MQIEAATWASQCAQRGCREGEVRQYEVHILFYDKFVSSLPLRSVPGGCYPQHTKEVSLDAILRGPLRSAEHVDYHYGTVQE
jgi:hypothetical protein